MNDCKVLTLYWKNQKREIKKLLSYCDDEAFQYPELCSTAAVSSVTEDPPDIFYISFDSKTNTVCGVLTASYLKNKKGVKDSLYLAFLTSRAITDPTTYRGVGTSLVNTLKNTAYSDPNIEFIYMSGADYRSIGFYLKQGFKMIGNTGTLIFKVKSIPDINRIRWMAVPRARKFIKGSKKRYLGYSKKQDTEERWRRDYGSPDETYGVVPTESNNYIYTDFSSIELYPDWMYKYGRMKK